MFRESQWAVIVCCGAQGSGPPPPGCNFDGLGGAIGHGHSVKWCFCLLPERVRKLGCHTMVEIKL